MSNTSEENLYIYLDLPVLIDSKKIQTSAEKWADDEFVAGMIYAGASVHTNSFFKRSRLGERPPGGKVVVTYHEREPPATYHIQARLKGEACYFVTYCYSRQSPEYVLMIKYRDEILSDKFWGRTFIHLYYFLAPFIVHVASKNKIIDHVLRKVVELVIKNVNHYYQSKEE